MTFEIDFAPAAKFRIRELAQSSEAHRMDDSFRDAFRKTAMHLQKHPLEWNDPEYDVKRKVAVVRHGVAWPLLVHSAVYEADQAVVISDIGPLPNSSLADP